MTKYYTYNATTRTLSTAPKAVRTANGIVCNPTAEQYAAIGAYPLAVSPAPLPSSIPIGKIAVPDGYELQDNAWVRTYRYEDAPPPPPRTFSKYRLVCACRPLTSGRR